MRRRLSRAGQLLGLGTVAASLLLLGAVPASAAAAPPNDTIAGATAISAVPFADAVDTTEATTDAEDAAINAQCGAPATNGSVWYTFQAGDAPGYLFDVSKSSFTAGVILATGTPGNLEIYACGPDAIAVPTTAGTTYYVMAFSDNPDVVGGQLAFEVREATPAPGISMTVDDVGSVDKKTGVATISGTYTCDGTADYVALQGSLQQEQDDDVQVTGDFFQENLACGGTFDWSAEVTATSGAFKRGLAATAALTVGCADLGCNLYQTLEVVRLRG